MTTSTHVSVCEKYGEKDFETFQKPFCPVLFKLNINLKSICYDTFVNRLNVKRFNVT